MSTSNTSNHQLEGGKYIVVLTPEKRTSATVRKAQRDLGVKLTSSAELGGGVRAQDVLAGGSGIVFKNLGIAVVDELEEPRAARAGTVVHVERERRYRATSSSHAEAISELRATLEVLSDQLDTLEDSLPGVIATTDDTGAERMTWGLSAINAGVSERRGSGVRVCVLDTGLHVTHPDFAGRGVLGKSFIPGEAWDVDPDGHGTHVAGVLCGGSSRENGLRYGVAPDVSLLVAKVLDDRGDGATGSILDGIDWALEKEARILNLSLGTPVGVGDPPSPVFELVGERAMARGCLLVAAAGNESRRPRQVPRPVDNPANARSVLAVAAVGRNRKVARFSNAGINPGTGGRVDLCAPGVDIYSSFRHRAGEYRSMDGTSMATPFVAGVAALYAERFPGLSAAELWLKLEKGALPLPGAAGPGCRGWVSAATGRLVGDSDLVERKDTLSKITTCWVGSAPASSAVTAAFRPPISRRPKVEPPRQYGGRPC